ncbi:response regulator, partial [Methylorubrum suomiense]
RLESGGPDLDSALTAAIAALGTFMGDASEGCGRSGRIPATALRGAVPSHRVRASSRPGPGPTRTEAAAFTLAAALEGVVTLIRESARPEMARVPPRETDLPPVRRMRG